MGMMLLGIGIVDEKFMSRSLFEWVWIGSGL